MGDGEGFATKVSFIGHKPGELPFKYDEQDPACIDLKDSLEAAIYRSIALGANEFVSSLDIGVGVWAAEAVIRCQAIEPRFKLHAALLCENQDAVWPQAAKERFQAVRKACVSEEIVNHGTYQSWFIEKRDRRLVDLGDIVIVVWNNTKGAVEKALNYAVECGKPIFLVDAASHEITPIAGKTKVKV